MSAAPSVKARRRGWFWPERFHWGAVAVVSLVTVMIWLFAEAESLAKSQHEARLRFVDPSGAKIVKIISPGWDGTVTVTVQGPASAVQNAPAILGEGVEIPLNRAGVPDADGEQPVDMRTALRADRRLSDAGLTVVDVEPATLRIDVEPLDELSDVEVVPEVAGVELAEPVVVDPPRVHVRGPSTVIGALKSLARGPRVIARPSAGAVEGLTPGARQTIDATVTLPPAIARDRSEAQVTPSTVRLTLTIKGRKESIRVPSAPVQVLLPPHELDKWRVEINPDDQLVKDVRITGPGELISQVRDGRIPVVAVLALSSDDLQARIAAKPIDFWRLPPGLTVEGGDAPIRLTIEPRTPSGMTGPEPQ